MEQALVFASIVLGVAVAFELDHLNKVLRSDKVKWHWAQPLFALYVLLTIISYWWSAANAAEGTMLLAEFLPVMFQLVMLVLLAAVSLPDRVEPEGVDLAAYYQSNRRYQWILFSLFIWSMNLGWFARVWARDLSMGDFLTVIAGDAVGGLVVVAMIFARRWWQVALGMAVLSLGPIIWLSRSLG